AVSRDTAWHAEPRARYQRQPRPGRASLLSVASRALDKLPYIVSVVMHPLTTLITQLGPLGVFLLMVPESACVPIPSELTLGFAGFAVSAGWMPLWLAIAAATG